MTMNELHYNDVRTAMGRLIQTGLSHHEAREQVAESNRALYGAYPQLLAERLDALDKCFDHFAELHNRVSYLQRQVLRFGREHWYLGPDPDSPCWNGLLASLRSIGRDSDEVSGVDEESTLVVGLLPNPTKERFSSRGLVVGHVQSGKTGNIAAVLTKAADTHYKFFIVLSGMTDQLRNQTQLRLSRDVVGHSPTLWHEWTSANEQGQSGEFRESAATGFAIDHKNQIAVLKKNTWVLKRFLGKLLNTSTSTLQDTPFLVIDDECDQASVNSARYDNEVTKTNGLIRKILERLPRAAYVGYTATPFANVLIDTSAEDDLYPRDFIHALRMPDRYFGAEALFGRDALEGEYDETSDGQDMIRIIPVSEAASLRPGRGAALDAHLAVPDSLAKAIRYFVMVVAARDVRGQSDEHSTMLVHTDVRNAVHESTKSIIGPHLADLASSIHGNDHTVMTQLADLWEEELKRVPAGDFGLTAVSFADLAAHLPAAVASITVHVENFQSEERLDYESGPRRYLVIGGNVLARGLTLHGLSVSYFLRSSSQYDTLMQMGRWFGYRSGFQDLPRVWVEDRVRQMYFDLATVEAEIRREIARYAQEELTPRDFAVRIRKIPGLLITARSKMRSAREVSVGLSGEHLQTIRFRRHDPEWLTENWNAASRLLTDHSPMQSARQGDHWVIRGIEVERVLRFFAEYSAHESTTVLASRMHARYIQEQLNKSRDLEEWNVVVVGGEGREARMPLGPLGIVRTVRRSAERGTGDAGIKALMSKTDLLLDLEGVSAPPHSTWDSIKELRSTHGGAGVLLIYPIEAESSPSAASRNRVPLNAIGDVLGMGVYFPGRKGEVKSYVSANLQPLDAIDDPEGDPIPEEVFDSERLAGEDG